MFSQLSEPKAPQLTQNGTQLLSVQVKLFRQSWVICPRFLNVSLDPVHDLDWTLVLPERFCVRFSTKLTFLLPDLLSPSTQQGSKYGAAVTLVSLKPRMKCSQDQDPAPAGVTVKKQRPRYFRSKRSLDLFRRERQSLGKGRIWTLRQVTITQHLLKWKGYWNHGKFAEW